MKIDSTTVVVITGASSGIGWETALLFAQKKARVVLAARTDSKLFELARLIEAQGGSADARPTDVSDEAACQRLIDDVLEKYGRIDILVNNAGYGHYASVDHLQTEDLERILKTNLFGSFWCIKATLPSMKAARRGHIVNISTIISQRAVPYMSAYCMSKFAMNALDESLALEVRSHGIGVSLVCPGLTHTGFQAHAKKADFAPPVSNANGMNPAKVAKAILRAVEKNRRRTYLTASGRALVWMQRLSPRFVDAALVLMYSRKAKHGTV